MKPGGVVSLKKINSIGFLSKNRVFVSMCFAFVVGVVVGSISLSGGGRASGVADKLLEFYISNRKGAGFFGVFFSALLGYFTVCLTFFAFGASVIGVVFSPLMCCGLGIYFGCLSAYIYSAFSLKGIAFNAIVLIPSALSFCVCAFFAAKASFCFSAVILKLLLPKSRPSNLSVDFRLFCGRYLIILAFLIAVSLIDAAVSTAFLKFFDF